MPRQVQTLLFTDIVSSTEHLRQLGDPAWAALLRRHHGVIRSVLAAHGGREVNTAGDGFLARFDAPSPAVRAAVAAVVEVASLGIEIRAGLHTGEVELDGGGIAGVGVHLAARVMAQAVAGQVLVSSTVRELMAGSGLGFVDLGVHELKGFSEGWRLFALEPATVSGPVQDSADSAAWTEASVLPSANSTAVQVLSAVPCPSWLTIPATMPIAGREAELEVLRTAIETAVGGHRRAVLVSGEPGIGKTRLVGEAARKARDQGILVLGGRCDPDLAAPFGPVTEALRQIVASVPAEEVSAFLGDWPGELIRIVPELTSVLSSDEVPRAADPETERWRLFDAVVSALKSLAYPAGLVLVVDDLQWATPATVSLLRHALRSENLVRVAFLLTYRDVDIDGPHPAGELVADAHRTPDIELVPLTGLEHAAVTELVVHTTGRGGDPAAKALALRLGRETSGNPFFIGELLRTLDDSGLLRESSGLERSADLATIELPAGARNVIERRLASLDDDTIDLLRIGAVVGVEFDAAMIAAVKAMEMDACMDLLDRAAAHRLITDLGADRWQFVHALVRSALYDQLNPSRRGRRHRQIAELLESSQRRDPVALAHHWSQAGGGDGALHSAQYALLAASAALEQAAPNEAVLYLERALHDVQRVGIDDPELTYNLNITMADAQYRLVDISQATDAARRAAGAARQLHSCEGLARVAEMLASSTPVGIANDEALKMCSEALAAATPGDNGLRARILATVAEARSRAGQDALAEAPAVEALSIARRSGGQKTLRLALEARLLSLLCTTDFDAQCKLADELVVVAGPDLFALVSALEWRATVRLIHGDMDGFLGDWAELAPVTVKIGWKWGETLDVVWQAMWALLVGEFDRVVPLADKAVALGDGSPGIRHGWALQMFWLAFEQGRLADFRAVAEAVAADNPGLSVARAALAMLHAELGETDAARDLLGEFSQGGFEDLPGGQAGHMAPVMLSHAAGLVGSSVDAEALRGRLLPFRGRLAVIGAGAVCAGPFDHYLGMLNARSGHWHEAADSFDSANELATKIGARPAAARSLLGKAKTLLAAGDPGRRGEAVGLVAAVAKAAAELGMAGLAAEAAATEAYMDA